MVMANIFKNTHDYGSWAYAIVEGISNYKATVLLKENGARLTNLTVAGSRIKVGDLVMIDYSSGNPVIRPITYNKSDPSTIEDMESIISSGIPSKPAGPITPPDWNPFPVNDPTDLGCRLWAFAQTDMDAGNEYDLVYREAAWDTNEFWSSGSTIITKVPGMYMAIARISFEITTERDTRFYSRITVDGTTQASITSNPILDAEAVPKTYEMTGALVCQANSEIKVKVKQDNNFKYPSQKKKMNMNSDDMYHMYPVIELQWMGTILI
jgi:hypothetical protein